MRRLMTLWAMTAILLATNGTVNRTEAAEPMTGELMKIRQAAPEKPIAPPKSPRRVLVFNKCAGYVHSAIPYGAAAIRVMGDKTGAYEAVFSTDASVFTPEKLAKFDVIVFNNTSGQLFDDAQAKQALLDFVRGGKGIVGIHAATDCFYNWPEFGEMMGGYFDGHPWNEDVVLKVEQPNHPLVAMFDSEQFRVADEIYQFKAPYSRDNLRVLLSLSPDGTDMNKDGMKRDDGDYAVSWCRNYGRGRVFYCSLGHRHEIFWNPTILKHYLAGIQYAAGDLQACAVPSAQIEDDGWIRLFNGKDLSGWWTRGDNWKVEDGVLTRAGKGGSIWSQNRFGDFVLELEFKIAPRSNSGVFFRCGSIEDWLHTCIEMQVLDSYGKADPGKHDCGAIYDVKEPSKNMVRPPGDWNHVRITAEGSEIQVVMNGEQIIDIDLDNWTSAHKNPDGTKNKFRTAYKDMPREGHFGLQDHGDPVWYRNIRVKRLD